MWLIDLNLLKDLLPTTDGMGKIYVVERMRFTMEVREPNIATSLNVKWRRNFPITSTMTSVPRGANNFHVWLFIEMTMTLKEMWFPMEASPKYLALASDLVGWRLLIE